MSRTEPRAPPLSAPSVTASRAPPTCRNLRLAIASWTLPISGSCAGATAVTSAVASADQAERSGDAGSGDETMEKRTQRAGIDRLDVERTVGVEGEQYGNQPNLLALAIFTLVLVSLSTWRFRKQLG